MQTPSENAFQVHVHEGQFVPMGCETIDMGRMTASCVELLRQHLGMSAEEAGRVLNLDAGQINAIANAGKATNPASIPNAARPAVHKLCAIQSFLLSGYTIQSLVAWFESMVPGLNATPANTLKTMGSPGLDKVLQAAIGRASH